MKSNTSYFYALFFVLLASCAFGQEVDKKKFAVKMYSESTLNLDRDKTSVELFRTFSLSISWGREYGNFQEVEIKDFKLSFNETSSLFQVGMEYSYNWMIAKRNKKQRVNFFVGAGAGAGSQFIRNNSSQQVNFNLVLIPRMTVNLGKRTSLDVSVPYNYYRFNNSRFRSVNWIKSGENFSSSNPNPAAFPNQFTVKVGVAFKF